MRKVVVILLLFCFLFQAGGLWLLMYSRQMALKREMKARLRSDPNQFEHTVFEFELVKGEPVAPSFEWEEDENEFRYNGSIYDVIEKKVTGSFMILRCINDEQESAIIKKIEDLQKKGPGNDKSGLIQMQQLLSLLLFDQDNRCEQANLFSHVQHIDQYIESFKLIIIDIQSPPPRQEIPFTC